MFTPLNLKNQFPKLNTVGFQSLKIVNTCKEKSQEGNVVYRNVIPTTSDFIFLIFTFYILYKEDILLNKIEY